VSAGSFGERWAALTRAFGVDLVHVRLDWGETPEPEDLGSALRDAGDVRAVYLVHSETSTGVVADGQALVAVAKDAGARVVADLGLLLDEGLEAAFVRHARLGRACREGAKAMGLDLFSPDEDRSAVVTAIRAPDGVDATRIVAELRERFGITIANGQGELKGK